MEKDVPASSESPATRWRMDGIFRALALLLFALYLALFPGSTITVALDRVPAWGAWMGGALLMLQGGAVLCWLLGNYRGRGLQAALLVLLGAWAVEHAGVTTGLPFGRYRYTDVLQPQLLGVVPLPIVCAWLMVAVGAWQLAYVRRSIAPAALVAPSLVVLLDVQIETIATAINRYWIWIEGGPYYGVPTANFVAWWLVGAVLTLVVEHLLRAPPQQPEPGERPRAGTAGWTRASGPARTRVWLLAARLQPSLPMYLYILSTLMFSVVNLARGYVLAGIVGAAVLLSVARRAWR